MRITDPLPYMSVWIHTYVYALLMLGINFLALIT